MRLRRVALILVVIVLAVPLALAGTLWAVISTGAATRWAEGAVERATGHAVRIDGAVHVAPGLVPTLAVEDVALLNPPGFSRPDLAHARRVEAQVALLPLLHGEVEVRRIRLAGLDMKLEVNAAGQRNWERPPVPAPTAPVTPSESRHFAVSLRRMDVSDSVLTWSGPGGPLRLDVPRLTAEGRDTLDLAGEVQLNAVPLRVQGAIVPAAPWPTYVALTGQGVSLALHARGGEAIEVSVEGAVAAPALDPRLAGLGEVKLNAAWSPGAARFHAEAAPWTPVPGLQVEGLTLDAPAMDQPVRLHATLAGAVRLALAAETGSLGAALAGGPLPIAVAAWGEGGTAQLQGALADPRTLRGLDATLSAQVSNLAALAPNAPPLHDAALTAHVTDPVGLARGVAVRGLSARLPQGDVTGDLAVSWQPRPALRGTLLSRRVDVDALLALFPERPAQPSAAAATPEPSPAPAVAPARLIPDTPLPTAGLRVADADIAYSAEALHLGGAEFHGVQAQLRLADGALQLDPLTATSPGGPIRGRASLDAAASPPRVGLSLDAPNLGLSAFLPGAEGTMGINVDLQGQGATWRQVAAALGGEADVTGVNGQLDLGKLGALGEALRRVPGLSAALSGQASLRCLAIRAAVANGVATVAPLLLDAGRLALRGDGRVDLRDEELDLHLRAVVRFGPTEAELPLRVTGTLADPKVEAEAVGGRFGLMPAGQAQDGCGPALAAARGGRPGPEPAPLANEPHAARPADLLRSLLR